METRVISIGIRKYLVRQPRNKRARKAARYFREKVAHYTKTDVKNVKIDRELNSMIMKYYSRRMSPIKASVKIDNGTAMVSQFEGAKAAAQPKPKGSTPSGKESKAAPVQRTDGKDYGKSKGADRTENAKGSGEPAKPKAVSRS